MTIGLLVALGVASEWSRTSALQPFDLDGETTVPAALSTLLLGLAAVLVLRVRGTVLPRALAWIFAAILVYAASDEIMQLHERLERRLGVDWQQIYLPAFVVALVAWLLLLVAIRRHRQPLALVVASACALATSQVLEYVQWDGDRPVPSYKRLMVTEETLEMLGAALLVIALLALVRSAPRAVEVTAVARA